MLDRDQFTPAELQNQSLIQDLSGYYDTQTEDTTSLARIRARLLQTTATSLPVVIDEKIARFPLPLPGQITNDLPQKKSGYYKAIRNNFHHPYLKTLTIAALLTIVIGSFALVLHLQQGKTTDSQPVIAHGWSLVAQLSGTGNKTITEPNIVVGHKLGWLINCTNSSDDVVSVKINGEYSGGGICQAQTTEPLGPGGSLASPEVLAPIQTIEVIAPASISWNVWLFKGTYYPPMKIDAANWHALHDEMDGTGNGTWLVGITLPATWGLQFICHGTGTFKVGLQSSTQLNAPDIVTDSKQCNGSNVTFDRFENNKRGTIVRQVQVTTNTDNDWQIVLVSCTNDKIKCDAATVTPTF